MAQRRLVWIAMLVLCGCYTPRYGRTTRVFGDFVPARDLALAERAEALPWQDYADVRVVAGALPAGLTLASKGELIKVEPEAADRYEVLGAIESITPASGYPALYWTFPMHDSESAARSTYCAVQAPLRLLTFGVWSLFSPLNWACLVDERPDGAVHLRELKRSATAMGGNLIVVRGVDDSLPRRAGVEAGNFLEVARVAAFVLRDRAPGADDAPVDSSVDAMRRTP